MNPTGNMKSMALIVKYSPKMINQKIVVVNDVDGQMVKDASVSGRMGTSTNVASDLVPDGFKLVDPSQVLPTKIDFNKGEMPDIKILVIPVTVKVTSDSPKADTEIVPGTKNVHFHGVSAKDLISTVTRVITIKTPDGKSTTKTDTVTFKRDATFDAGEESVTYGDWSENGKYQFAAVDAPKIAGYTANIPVEAQALTIFPNIADISGEITYVPDEQTMTIRYVYAKDPDIGIDETTVKGVTNSKGTYTVDQMNQDLVHDGWDDVAKLADDQKDVNYTFKADGNNVIVIYVYGKTVTVTPDQNIGSDDTLPSGDSYPDGVSHSDLNKTITRTIKVTDPKGKIKVTKQTVNFKRTATIDLLALAYGDDAVTYSNWTSKHPQFDEFDVQTVDGFTPTQAKVEQEAVTPDSKDENINITYGKEQDMHPTVINYVDENGQTVKSVNVNGKIGDAIKLEAPQGYHFDKGNVPALVIDASKPTQTVTVIKDKIDTGDPIVDTKQVANIINFTDKDGNIIHRQEVFGKDGDKIVPEMPKGYHTADFTTPALTINAKTPVQTVTIIADQSKSDDDPMVDTKDVLNVINYVDKSNKQISQQTVTGKDGDKIDVQLPKGYYYSGKPSALVIDAKNPVHSVTVEKDNGKSQHESTVDSRDVANIIEFMDKDGNKVNEKIASGKVGDKISINVPDGYHFIDGKTPDLTINAKNPVQKVIVEKDSSKPDNNPTIANVVNFVDKDGNRIASQNVTGKAGDKISLNVPNGYHFVDGKMPSLLIIATTPVQTVIVEKDKSNTDEPTVENKDVLNTIRYVDENGNVIKTDTVTGKIGDSIALNVPTGYHLADNTNLVITKDGLQVVKVAKDESQRPAKPVVPVKPKGKTIENTAKINKHNGGNAVTASATVVTSAPQQKANNNSAKLPQTGNQNHSALAVLGLGMMALVGGLLGKRKQDQLGY